MRVAPGSSSGIIMRIEAAEIMKRLVIALSLMLTICFNFSIYYNIREAKMQEPELHSDLSTSTELYQIP